MVTPIGRPTGPPDKLAGSGKMPKAPYGVDLAASTTQHGGSHGVRPSRAKAGHLRRLGPPPSFNQGKAWIPDDREPVRGPVTSHVVVTQKGDWVHFDYSEPLGEVREFAYHGESVGSGGCSFSGEETAGGPDQPPGVVIEEREVATNLRGCIMRTERGVSPTLVSTPEAGQFREDGASSRGVTSDLNAPAASRQAWHRTFYEDPPRLGCELGTNQRGLELQWWVRPVRGWMVQLWMALADGVVEGVFGDDRG